jgi:hypothetical protein
MVTVDYVGGNQLMYGRWTNLVQLPVTTKRTSKLPISRVTATLTVKSTSEPSQPHSRYFRFACMGITKLGSR